MHDHQLDFSILAAVIGLNIHPPSASVLSDADLLAARISLIRYSQGTTEGLKFGPSLPDF
jgi:hypothetical protein